MNSYEPVPPPVTWFGSKSRLVKKIVNYFPEHHTYVDVFGGSGAVLLGKPPSKVEVYNDLNKKMASLFNVLRDKIKTQELVRRLELTPYSKEAFKHACISASNEQDEIELAKLMIVIQRQSHGGLGKQWSYCVDATAGGYSASVRRFHTGIERLPKVQSRMRKVQIENLSFTDLIPRYDRPETLFYLDPPYVPDTRINGKYENEMTVDDHCNLVEILLNSHGMFILSGYETKIYSPLEISGWTRVDIETYEPTSKYRSKRTECLWISPNCFRKALPEYVDINNNESLTKRQKCVLRVHRYRREQSELSIKKAICSLNRMEKRITKIEVSRITGISREHISRHYSHLF